MGRWTVALPPSINALILGKSEEATGHGVSEIPNNLARGYQLIREIRSSHPDAVMVLGYGNLAHVMVIAWCRHNHIPCMMWGDSNILGDRNKGLKALIKKVLVSWVIRKCTAILSCGTLGARYFQRYGANSKQIFYVPNEPDYSAIENISTNEVKSISDEFLIAKDRHRLIFSGRLVSVKRVDLLIDAFVHIADRCPDWDLLIAGGGPLESELKSRVPHRLQHRIIWAGFIDSSRRMSVLYRLSDVLILPSDNEPWALVVNEAACAGLALVCSDVVGAAAQLLHDKINGRIFRAGDLTSLVNALLDVTDVTNLARYRTATPLILENWRKIADPVEGFRRALDYCWNPALAPDEQPEEELKGVY
jgi:glycosyltransferase involved in cell wall biosynthesis